MDGSDDGPAASVAITKPVRLIAPFVLTFGLFTLFHGTSSVGGGFQGGVVVASVVVALAFAFGLDQTGNWLDRTAVTALALVGVVWFAAVGLGSVLFGGRFMEWGAYPLAKAPVYAIETVEVGIGVTVAATVVVLLFLVAESYDLDDHDDGEGDAS